MFLALRHILRSPKRLKVREVKALPLLYRVREIEGCTRPDVVNVPAVASVIVPSHAGFELDLQPRSQEISSASTQHKDSACFPFTRATNDSVNSISAILKESIQRIDFQSSEPALDYLSIPSFSIFAMVFVPSDFVFFFVLYGIIMLLGAYIFSAFSVSSALCLVDFFFMLIPIFLVSVRMSSLESQVSGMVVRFIKNDRHHNKISTKSGSD
jgi:hypothetical protein